MAKSKAMCSGCYDDFYNQNRDGGCWGFATATVVKRVRVGTFQTPPYSESPQSVLSCFHCTGYSFLRLDDCRLTRNWKATA